MKYVLLSCMLLCCFAVFAQQTAPQKANYALAARFSPDKINKMLFSTTVDPHWLKLMPMSITLKKSLLRYYIKKEL